MASGARKSAPAVAPVAGVLGWVVPGLGHVYRGEAARGGLIALGVLGLFLGGLLIGGLGSVDTTAKRFETRLSFAGQVLVGPLAIATNRIHQSRFKAPDPDNPRVVRHAGPSETIRDGRIVDGGEPPMTPAVGRIHEIGVLYALLAGMLNFIAILDALLPSVRGRSGGDEEEEEEVRVSSVVAAAIAERGGARASGGGP